MTIKVSYRPKTKPLQRWQSNLIKPQDKWHFCRQTHKKDNNTQNGLYGLTLIIKPKHSETTRSNFNHSSDVTYLSRIGLMESGILGFGVWNTAQGIRNPTSDWYPESKFHWQILESSTSNPEPMTWNPESRTVLDSRYMGRFINSNLIIFFQCQFSVTILCTLRQSIAIAHRLLKNFSPHFLSDLQATSS